MHVGHARYEFLIQEIIELTPVSFCYFEAEVRSSSVSVVYVVRLRIILSKAKWGSMEPMEPPLDSPLLILKIDVMRGVPPVQYI